MSIRKNHGYKTPMQALGTNSKVRHFKRGKTSKLCHNPVSCHFDCREKSVFNKFNALRFLTYVRNDNFYNYDTVSSPGIRYEDGSPYPPVLVFFFRFADFVIRVGINIAAPQVFLGLGNHYTA